MIIIKRLVMALAMGVLVVPAYAQNSLETTSTAEIRLSSGSSTDSDSGIRIFSGNTSTLFWNVQGDDDGFAVFSVADFDFSAATDPTAVDVTNVSLDLSEDPAGFGNSGLLMVFAVTDNDPNLIDANNNPSGAPAFQTSGGGSGNTGADTIDPVFGTALLLGQATWTNTGSSDDDLNIPLTLNAVARTILLSAINNGEVFRIIVAPGEDAVAFTGAGIGNSDGPAPTLNYSTVIPEPASLILMGLGGLSMLRRKRH